MAFADFTLTSFGEQWIAQAVQDAQDETHLAVLVAMDFGESDGGTPPSMDTLWCSDTASLYTWQGSNVIGIRGVASNLQDTESHAFDFIQIRGTLSGVDGVIAYCESVDTETIPPASVQQVTRVATVSLAVSGEATVTMATPQTGYAIEEEVAKIAPAVNLGGIILGDGNGHTSTIGCNAQSALTVSGGVRASGSLTSLGNVNAFTGLVVAQGGAQIVGASTFSDDLTIGGDAKAANLPVFAVFSRASLSDEYTGQVDGVTLTQESAATIFSEINSAATGRGIYACVDSINAAGVAPKCVPISYAQTMSTSDFPLPSSVGGCVLVVRWR